MIKYLPTLDLSDARVWYIMEDASGTICVPALVLSQNGPIVRLNCLTRALTPELNLNDPADQARISWRTMTRAPGDPKHVRRTNPNIERRTSGTTQGFI